MIGDYIDLRDIRSGHLESSGTLIPNMIGQVVRITGKSSNNLSLADEISIDHTNFQPFIRKIIPKKNVGIEDLKITRPFYDINVHQLSGHNIYFRHVVNSWVKGVESANSVAMHINIETSSHTSIIGNYIHHSSNYSGQNGTGYGVALYHRSTNCLIEDNNFSDLRHAMLVSTSANRNVFGFNYSKNRHSSSGVTEFSSHIGDISLHGNFPHGNLFESNIIENIFADDWFAQKHSPTETLLT